MPVFFFFLTRDDKGFAPRRRVFLLTHLCLATTRGNPNGEGSTPSLGIFTQQGEGSRPPLQFLVGQRVQKVRPHLFLFYQRDEKGQSPPRRVLSSFSTASQWRGGSNPSSSCFPFVFNGEEGQNPPCRVFLSFSTARRGLTTPENEHLCSFLRAVVPGSHHHPLHPRKQAWMLVLEGACT